MNHKLLLTLFFYFAEELILVHIILTYLRHIVIMVCLIYLQEECKAGSLKNSTISLHIIVNIVFIVVVTMETKGTIETM